METTAVEAVLGGYRALGLDMNVLSVLMARVKCAISSVDPKPLVSAYESIRDRLQRTAGKRNRLAYFRSLPARDQEYLAGWFSEQVLEDLDEVAQAIQASDKQVRDLFWICLSNIIRSVSWQKKDDLRTRKELRLDVENRSDPDISRGAGAFGPPSACLSVPRERSAARGTFPDRRGRRSEPSHRLATLAGKDRHNHHVAAIRHSTTVFGYRPAEPLLSRIAAPTRTSEAGPGHDRQP